MCFDLVLYGIGIVELTLESTSAVVLLLFIVPLAFTLSGFLLWIMYALNGMWQVFKKSFCCLLVVSFFSDYCPPSSTETTVQIEDVPTTASCSVICRADCHRVLRCLLDVFFRKAR